MTAGTNAGGNGTPEDDDPFAYLYRQDGEAGGEDQGTATVPGQQYGAQRPQQQGRPGVPRTSYNQVTPVGRTSYGQRGQGGYGYPPQQQYQQSAQPQYQQQPGREPGYPEPAPVPHPRDGQGGGRRAGGPPRGSGGNRGLLIGAIAVVVAVAVGIAMVVLLGDNGGKSDADKHPTATPTNGGRTALHRPAKKREVLPPVTDAIDLALVGGAQKSSEHPGALGAGGQYVDHMDSPGATVTWNVRMQRAGQYRLDVRYGNAGDDAGVAVAVNGKPTPRPIKLNNFTKTKDWDNAWFVSWGLVNLKKGENTVSLTCGAKDKCAVNLDQVAITRNGYPKAWS